MNPVLKLLKQTKAQALVLTVIIASAQFATAASSDMSASNSERLKIVPSLGYSYFNISGSSSDFKSKSGSSAAVLVQMPMTSNLEVESGLEYLETGAKQSLDFGFLSLDTAQLEVKQLAVPVRAKYIFNPASQGTHYFGKAGLTPTYVIGAKMNALGQSSDVKSTLNDLGLLTQAGLGADWGLDSITGRISFDFTYSYGLTKVFKDADGRSTGFQLQLGYAFML